jgi:hypothetical protein
MNEEVDNILNDYYEKKYDLLEVRKKILILFKDKIKKAEEKGYNQATKDVLKNMLKISTEKME